MVKPSDQAFYPSVVVNLRLRFDEAMQVDEISTIPRPQPQDGIVDAVSGADLPTSRPLVTQRGASNLSFVLNRVPRTAQVELPAYRQAGKFTLEFDWRELPIDPRLVRACGVEIYIGSVDPGDFGTGMTQVDAKTGRRRSVLQVVDATGAPRDDLMALAGVVDNWSVSHSEGSTVKIEGRDLRGIFLDSPINPITVGRVRLDRPLIAVLVDILRTHPAAKDMKILFNPDDWPGGEPPPVADQQGLTRVRLGADGDGASGGTNTDAPSFWDVITRYCFLVGAIPFFRGRNLVVRPSRSIFDQSKPTAGPRPGPQQPKVDAVSGVGQNSRSISQATGAKTWDPVFSGDGIRVDDDGNPFYVRKFIFGRNLKELNFERKLSGVKVPMIEVVSYDTSSTNRGKSKLLIAQWPPRDKELARMTGVAPSGEVSQTDKIQISVPGVRDMARLTAIARSLYEEIGRGELGGSAQTGFLSSFKGSNADPDVCRLRPGHAVELLMDNRQMSSRMPAANTELALERASFDEAVKIIQRALRTSDDNLARVIVASSRGAVIGQLRMFRVANVVFNWSQDAGLASSFDFQNYLVARHDVGSKLGPNVTPAVSTSVSRKPQAKTDTASPAPAQVGFGVGGIRSAPNGFIEVPVLGQEPF